jgi:hypothetical protein
VKKDSLADQNDPKCFLQVIVTEGTKEIKVEELDVVLVKEELDVVPDDPLSIVKQEPFWNNKLLYKAMEHALTSVFKKSHKNEEFLNWKRFFWHGGG